jgi:diaminopimelate decarboxylase
MTTASAQVEIHFPVVNDELVVGGVPLTQLAASVGRTPFYAYDRRAVQQRVEALRAVLPREVRLHYAIKANPMPALVGYMAGLVDGLDVASGNELRIAIDAGANPDEISFAGPGKTEAELSQAIAAGVLINLESFREIRLCDRIASRLGRSARVAVRVNPDFELKSSGMKMGGGAKQFGIDSEQVPEALAEIAAKKLCFEGFHIFSGSQNLRAESICESMSRGFELACALAAAAPVSPRVLNLGGGFGIPYFQGEKPLDLAPIGERLKQIVELARERLPNARIVIELGRYLVGEAGVYVCRVIDRKVSRGQVFLIVDGGLHQHLAASGNFGQVIRKNYPVAVAHRVAGGRRETVSIVGPLCTPLDILADRVEVGEAVEGDLIAVFQSGAYGLTASPINFLGHPHPVEVLV